MTYPGRPRSSAAAVAPFPFDTGLAIGDNTSMPRFILLEHSGAPDDPAGLHWDLLLEDDGGCRTWRLTGLPRLNGPAVHAEEIAPHRLAWLDHEAGEVSGGRGFARRIDAGSYEPALRQSAEGSAGERVVACLTGDVATRRLVLVHDAEGWTARLESMA